MRILLPERKRKSDISSYGLNLQNEMVANKIMFEGFFLRCSRSKLGHYGYIYSEDSHKIQSANHCSC